MESVSSPLVPIHGVASVTGTITDFLFFKLLMKSKIVFAYSNSKGVSELVCV